MPWARIIGRQVPLMARRASEKWGAIDLLGLDAEHRPVVIELKKAVSPETPLRALLEAAAYAVSVEANWAVLSEEIARLESGSWSARDAVPIAIVVVAPTPYWSDWNRWSTSGRGVPVGTRSSLRTVATALSAAGIPPSFVAVDYGEWCGTVPLETAIEFTSITPWV